MPGDLRQLGLYDHLGAGFLDREAQRRQHLAEDTAQVDGRGRRPLPADARERELGGTRDPGCRGATETLLAPRACVTKCT